jgi:hypothetical protein
MIVGATVFLGLAVWGATPATDVQRLPPVVMMIRSAQTKEERIRERRLFDQLSPALDQFMLISQDAEGRDFNSLPLAEQIAAVLPEAKHQQASAVIWMSFPLAHQLMLHVVALGPGRALVRTVETDRSPVSESTLALMARELLGAAYLFEPPETLPAEVGEVVREVKTEIARIQAPAQPSVVAPQLNWALWLEAKSAYPLAGGTDAIPVWQAGFSAERKLPWALHLALGADTQYDRISRPETAGAAFFVGSAALTLFKGFSAAELEWGPYGQAALSFGRFSVPGSVAHSQWPRFELGLQGRVGLFSQRACVRVSAGLTYEPLQAQIETFANQVLYQFPPLQLSVGIGVAWRGG